MGANDITATVDQLEADGWTDVIAVCGRCDGFQLKPLRALAADGQPIGEAFGRLRCWCGGAIRRIEPTSQAAASCAAIPKHPGWTLDGDQI
jgi:hypothetical protein